MKKILLLISIVFITLFSNKTNAQTIDNITITDTIDCPGLKGDIQVNILNPGNIIYNIVLQKMDAFTNFQSHKVGQWALNTTNLVHSFTNLSQGTYRVLLVDPTCSPPYNDLFSLPPDPCIYSSALQPIAEPTSLSLSVSDDTLDCWNDVDALITVNLNGYTQPYTVWLYNAGGGVIEGPVLLGSNDTLYTFSTPVTAGTYSIEGTGPINCPTETQFWTVSTPDTLRPNAQIITPISCYQANDGELSVDVTTGGTAPYTYLWTGPAPAAGSTGATVSGLGAGSYTCTVTDDNGCDTTVTLILTEPTELTASVDTIGSNDCNGDCDVEIVVTILLPGSGGPYTYSLDGAQNTPPTLNTFADNCAGSYNIELQDANGCDANTITPNPTVIPEPDLITVFASAKDYNGVNVSCFDSCNGEITIDSVTGGNLPPYGTSLPYLGGISFSPDTILDSAFCAPITYIDTVRDDLGCIGPFQVNLVEPDPFSIIADQVGPVSCPGVCDGSVLITPSGGLLGMVNYFLLNPSWSDSATYPNAVQSDTVCGLNTNGPATFYAINANGCIDTTTTMLSEPALFDWTKDSVMENCALGNGQASVTVLQGGSGTGYYTHYWTGPFGNNVVPPGVVQITPAGPNTDSDTIFNLQYGWYIDSVFDASGCYFIDSMLVDTGNILVDASVLVPCNDSSGVITLTTNGISLTSIVWTNATDVVFDLNGCGGPPGCNVPVILQNDSNFTTSILTGVTPQEYYYDIQLTGCDPVKDTILVGPTITMDASLDLSLSVVDLDCFGDLTDSIIIHVQETFGNSPSLTTPQSNAFSAYTVIPTYNASISNVGVPSTSSNFLQSGGLLPFGNYNIVITPQLAAFSNCFDTVPVSVIQPDSMQFTLGTVQTLCYGDSTGIIFVDTIFGGNSGEYNYIWTDATGAVIGNGSTDSINDLPEGWYYLSVTDSLNCLPPAIDSILVTSPDDISWTITINAIDSCGLTNAVGEVEVSSSGGMGVHTYEWNGLDAFGVSYPSVFNSVNSALVSGMHYIIITDTNNCTKNDSVFIENGEDPVLDPNSFTNVSCFGLHDGFYDALVDSVNGSLSFPYVFWNFDALPPNFEAGYIPSADSLGPGDTIVIKLGDNFGCQTSDTIIITEPDLLEITSIDADTFIGGYNISCNGSLSGSLEILAIGGTMPYNYSLQDSSITQDSSTYAGLASTYYVGMVQDDHGCFASDTIYLTQPDSLLIDSFFLDTTIAGGWNVSCFGFSDGQATVYVSGGNIGYAYAWSNGDTTNIADTLSANAPYTVTVTDTNDCIVSGSTAVLTEPTPLVIDNIIPTHLLCLGGDNGSATVHVSGATAGYSYLWDNANDTIPTYFNPNDTVASLNDTTAFADTLRAGTYNVEVWDTNGCYVTQSVTLTEPSISITIDSLAVTQMTCFTYDNADVKVFTTGPQPTPYLYTLYNEADELDTIYALNAMSPSPQGNIAFQALGDLNYVVYVEDNLGCLDRDTFIIHPLDSVYIDSVIYSNVSCYSYDDGYIEVIMPMGGTPPYQYSIDGGSLYPSWICNQNPNTCPTGFVFSGLAPGAYTVEIWDSNMCANSYQIIITEPPPMIIVDSTSNYNNYEIACNGGTDNVWFDIEGGASPYSVTDGSSTYPTNGSFTWTSLAAGTHTFTITDNNGCEQVFNITLNEPPAISVSPIITDVFCAGGSTGNITAVVSGGVGQGIGTNYTYQWTDVLGNVLSTSYFINNLSTGDYLLEVTDANGCPYSNTYTIGADALQIDISASTVNDVGCNGDCDGSISIVVQGGVPSSTGTYTYLWDDPLAQTTQTAIGLCAGTYTCIVTDMDGCIETASFIVNQPVAFEADISVYSPIQCNGGTGSLTVSATLPISTYLWSSGGSALVEPGLIAGSYSCFVTDANGCTDTALYNLQEPAVLEILVSDISVTDVDCYGNSTGEIQVTATGGTPIPGIPPTWTYVLSPATSTIVDDIATFTGLATGIYTVTVTDANGCSYTTNDIFVDEPDNDLEITIDSYDETCNQLANAIVYPTGGTPSYTVVWDGLSTTPHLTPQILSSGSNVPHTVVVTDANGCSVTESITLLGYENVFPGNASSFSETYCMGEQIVINIDERPGLSYIWTMSNGDTIATTANLNVTSDSSWLYAGNTLMLTITDDATGCYQTVTAIINIPDFNPGCTVLNEEAPITIIEGTEITLSSNNGYNTYQWTNTDGEELSTVNEFNFSPTNSDWYNLFVTNGNCIGYCSVYVAVGVIPVTGISPNGDTYNDDWYIQDLNKYDNSVVQLFNRWGDMLFEYKGGSDRITNNDFDWESLSIGTYYYIIDLGDGSLPQTGPLTIIK